MRTSHLPLAFALKKYRRKYKGSIGSEISEQEQG